MKYRLMFKASYSMGTFTVRACGWKASSTTSVPAAVERLIEKMYEHTPVDLQVTPIMHEKGFAVWTELKKELA